MANDITYEDIINKDILDLMGARDMPEEKKKELYTKMLETIQNRVIARVADAIGDGEMPEWERLAKEGDKTKMEEFLKSKDIDIAKLYLQEALIYKTEMVNLASAAKKQMGGK
jgi:hypothetical protein